MTLAVHVHTWFNCALLISASSVMSEKVENAAVICRICGISVIPEFSPTDQDGHPVHERCYASVTVCEIPVEPAEPEK